TPFADQPSAPCGADPAPGSTRIGYLPYGVSLVAFYALSILALGLAVHLLAGAITRSLPAGSEELARRCWWRWRVLPVLVCLPPLGLTLVRGQVQTLLLLCICGMITALLGKRRTLAGVCLALAACLKLFPAFLLVVPLARRDWRCLAGAAV